MSDVLSTPPEDVLQQRIAQAKLQKQLELDKSRILYEQLYQAELQRFKGAYSAAPTQQGLQPTPVPESFDDFYSKVRKAYSEAYALRAFREVMKEVTEETGQPPQTMPSADNITTSLMKSGLPPQAISQWLKGMDPEALGALIAYSSNNPMLAMMSYAMSQRQGQQQLTIKDVIELNAALAKRESQPNVAIDVAKIIESVRNQPTSDPDKIVDSTLKAIQAGMQLASPRGGGEEPRPRGILEQILAQPDGAKVAKELGLIGGDTPILNIMAEMRKNDQAFQTQRDEAQRRWELRLEQLHAETALKKGQLAESRRRTDLIAGTLRRVGSSIARGFSEGIAEGEGKKAEGKETTGGEALQQYECSCGATITVPPEAQVGSIVTCAKCGNQYEVTKSEAEK